MKAIIIGGGIIGLSTAYYLQKSGWDITVLDKTDLSDSCSYGNLGMIVPSHFVPLAAPGIISQGLRWMLNKKSPFYIRPSLNKNLLSWGVKFIRSANTQQVNKAAPHLLEMNLFSKQLYAELAGEPGFNFELENKGILMYYKTEKAGEEEAHLAEKAKTMGMDISVLSRQDVQALEPQMMPDVLGAVHYRSDAHLSPDLLVPQLLQHLKNCGVNFHINSAVVQVVKKGRRIKKVITTNREYEGDIVVMAGGSWLRELAMMAGVSLPLMPGKGYSFTLKQPIEKLNMPAILCEARVAITPMNNAMRYGGTMEIAPVKYAMNLNRVQGIVESTLKYFPGIHLPMPETKDIWYGFRPCTPDGLPYLGYATGIDNLLIAGGHAMSGLSLGPASGKLITELANKQQPSLDIKIFEAGRFS